MTEQPTPRRVRVTSPFTAASAHVRRSVREEIDEETGVGEVYIRSLMRSQLRAAAAAGVLLVPLVLLPVALTFFDVVATTRIGPVPLPWLLLGVLVYPMLFAIGWWYVRRAERAEADFAQLVDTPETS